MQSGDRQALAEFVRRGDLASARRLAERFAGGVAASAARRLGGDSGAVREVTRAVFQALGRMSARLGRRENLAAWLWRANAIACGKARVARLGWWARRARRRDPSRTLAERLAGEWDGAIDRLKPRWRKVAVWPALASRWGGVGEVDAGQARAEPGAAVSAELAGMAASMGMRPERFLARLDRARRRLASGLSRRLGGRGRGADVDAVSREMAGLEQLSTVEASGLATMAGVPPPLPWSSSLPELTAWDPVEMAASALVAGWDRARGLRAGRVTSAAPGGGAMRGGDLVWAGVAARTWRAMVWARWRRRATRTAGFAMLFFALTGGGLWWLDARTGHSQSIAMFLIWSVEQEGRRVPGLAAPATAWPQPGPDGAVAPGPSALDVRSAADLYQPTRIWRAHLDLAAVEWEAIQPRKIGPLPHFLRPDGTVVLRHPGAQRSGVAGVLGFDFDWGQARTFEFGGLRFHDVGVRLKGNGTFLGSLVGEKRAFKVDLNRHVRRQTLGGADELNFNNLVNDQSYVSDALAYEFFREAGVPASRTAYAYLSVSVEGKWDRKPLGLYAMVEPVDRDFARERFGTAAVPIFKPVTLELFADLGDDWSAYAPLYDLKTAATPEQQGRVMALSRLVTRATDAEFAAGIGGLVDLDEVARFLACEVLLSNYDGPLATGQNYYLYLDPGSGRLGFIPWDLDLAWGGFFLLGTPREREQASIWHPWVGTHRFFERLLAVPAFRERYRAALEELLARQFVPSRLGARIDALAATVSEPVAAESAYRYGRFRQAVGDRPAVAGGDESPSGARRPVHVLKLFIERRARSVRAQLDGRSEGLILQRKRDRDRHGNVNRRPDGDLPEEATGR